MDQQNSIVQNTQNAYTGERLDVPSDLLDARSKTETYTRFTFSKWTNIYGNEIEISNWCLEKTDAPFCGPDKEYDHIYAEIKRPLGESYFEEYNRLKKLLAPDLHNPKAYPPVDPPSSGGGLRFWGSQPDPEAVQRRLAAEEAMMDALRRAHMLSVNMQFIYPLWSLMRRDQSMYVYSTRPWPSECPPKYLLHLAKTGFASRRSVGLLAFGDSCTEAWIVHRFCRCDVHYVQKQNINFNDLTSEFRDTISRMDKNSALAAKNATAAKLEAKRAVDVAQQMAPKVEEIHKYHGKPPPSAKRSAARRNGRKGGRPRDLLWEEQENVRILWKQFFNLKVADRCEKIRIETGSVASDHTIIRISCGR